MDDYIDRNFDAVTKTEEWKMMSAEAVAGVLLRDELRPRGEIDVFHALVRWGRATTNGDGTAGDVESKEHGQDSGRGVQFVDLLGRCVRVPLLSSNELSVVMGEPLVKNSLAAQ